MADLAQRRASDDEWALRRKLAVMCRALGMQNSIGLYGHVSIRVPDTDVVLMTPGAGSRKNRVRTDQIFAFDLGGTILHHPGGDRPMQIPIELRIHTQIHSDRPEILCVAHLHAHASTLMGIARRDIVPVFSQGSVAHGGIPAWDDPRLVMSDESAIGAVAHAGQARRLPDARPRLGGGRRNARSSAFRPAPSSRRMRSIRSRPRRWAAPSRSPRRSGTASLRSAAWAPAASICCGATGSRSSRSRAFRSKARAGKSPAACPSIRRPRRTRTACCAAAGR